MCRLLSALFVMPFEHVVHVDLNLWSHACLYTATPDLLCIAMATNTPSS